MALLTSLKKSSPFISRISGIQRFKIRPFFNQSQPHSSSSPASASASSTVASVAAAAARTEEVKNTDSDFGLFFKSASGIVIGGSLGFWIWSSCSSSSSPSQSSISFADFPGSKDKHLAAVDNEDGNQHSSLHDVEQETKPKKYILGDSFRRKVFFNYEKRIRMRSPPEKVFEYFASHRSPEGEVFMTPADLMRAVVPVFPPSESNLVREGNLRGERNPGHLRCSPSSFFMLFDTNGDGLISFAEYIFFVTLLSIPESSFSVAFKMFDLDNNGEIDKEEFKKVMALMRAHNRQGAHHRDGRRAGIKKVGHSVENGGLLEFFFGKDGKSCLQHTKFVEFLKNLHEEMLRLEFAHYDYKERGTISAKDFALSMVASADMSHISKFLRRVDEINTEPHLKEMRFTLEEFMTFAELRKQLEPLSLAIFSYGKINGLLTKKDFQRAASHVCGINLTDNVVDLIYHVFDVNRDGSLSANEFINVLHRRDKEISHPNAEGASGLILCWLSCAKNCSFKDSSF